jgi:hypothetical protein
MAALSETIRAVKNRLVRLINEAIKCKFGINGGDGRICPKDLVIDPSASMQSYYFRDKAVYNKGPWKAFVNYNIGVGPLLNTTLQKLFLDINEAIIDGDIIVKLISPGQVIN